MDLKKKYVTDSNLVKEGVWFPFDEAEFLLTYYNATKAQLYFTSMLQKHNTTEIEPADAILLAMNDTLVEIVVLGWKNLKEDGVDLVYSKTELRRILEEYDGLGVELMQKALEIIKFKKEAIEEIKEK